MSNRILDAITRTESMVRARLAEKKVSSDQLKRLNANLDLSFEDWHVFQNLKSEAHASGLLSLEEAQVVYSYLGGTPQTFNGQSLAVKSVLTQLFGELLERVAKMNAWKPSKPVNGQRLPRAVSSVKVDETLRKPQKQVKLGKFGLPLKRK